jgi:metallo-beta-lactamase class B
VKVADNLYFVGQSEYSVWAITTSEGIILLDAIFDYSIEEEVDGGLKKLGLDPTKIKYTVVSHAHPDHYAGGKFLQDKYGAKVIMSAADWDVLDRANGTKPARDMVATDGQKLTLGDTTLTLYVTPGHTPGTISTISPGKRRRPNAPGSSLGRNGPQRRSRIFNQLHRVAKRFSDIARQAGADIIVSNHTDWDRSKVNLPLLAKRTPGSAKPLRNKQ